MATNNTTKKKKNTTSEGKKVKKGKAKHGSVNAAKEKKKVKEVIPISSECELEPEQELAPGFIRPVSNSDQGAIPHVGGGVQVRNGFALVQTSQVNVVWKKSLKKTKKKKKEDRRKNTKLSDISMGAESSEKIKKEEPKIAVEVQWGNISGDFKQCFGMRFRRIIRNGSVEEGGFRWKF